MGADPFGAAVLGLADTLHVAPAVTSIAVAALFATLGWIGGRRPGVGTIAFTVAVAVTYGLSLRLLADIHTGAFGLAAGIAAVAVGVAAWIHTQLGAGAVELAMAAAADRGMPVNVFRWIVDAAAVAVGLALGGPVGLGTAVCAVAFGPMVRAALWAVHLTAPGQWEQRRLAAT